MGPATCPRFELATLSRRPARNRCSAPRSRAAHPSHCLPPTLPEPPPRGRLIVLAAGKGAGSLTEAAERHYLASALAAGAARRHRRHPPRLRPADPPHRHGRGRPSGAGAAGLPAPNVRSRSPTRRAPTISSWCCCQGALRPTGSRRRRVSRLRKSRPRPGRCCAAAPISARSTACANISRASRAAASPGAPIRPSVVTLSISDVPGDDPR